MPKTKISEFSATPANNTDIDSINIAEGCAPSGINDAIRELMAQLKDFQTGAQGDSFGGPISGAVNATVGATTPNTGAFTTLTTTSNVGIAVTPSSHSPTGCIDLADGRIISFAANANFATNAYYNSGWKYKNTAVATNYSQTLGEHHYFTAASGTAGNAISFTEIMTLNASGNLGIGITSPVSRLHVKSTYASDTTTQQRFEDNTGSGLSFGGTGGGVKWLNVADVGTPSTGYPLAFQTGGSERARILANGEFLIGTTTGGGGKLRVANSGGGGVYVTQLASGNYSYLSDAISNGGTYYHFQFLQSGADIGSITSNGTITTYNTTSDYRLKNITGSLTGAKHFIMALQPKQGTWKFDNSKFVGFVAHEFQEVSPSSVTGTKDAVDKNGDPVYQGIQAASSEVMANLISLVQEQQTIIESLKARLDAANL